MTVARHLVAVVVFLGVTFLVVRETTTGWHLSWGSIAQAQAIETKVSAREVEVGEDVIVQATLMTDSDGARPESPRLPIQGAAEVHGPNLATQFRIVSRGLQVERRQGITATWSITPTAAGEIRVGPPSFQVDGKVIQGDMITVRVVEAGKGRRQSPRQRRRWPDPFGGSPFGRSPFDDPFFQDPLDFMRNRGGFDDPSRLGPYPKELAMDAPLGRDAFLRVDVSPKRAVVGEPVRLRIFAYGGRGVFDLGSIQEPSTPDFLSYRVQQDGSATLHRVPVGDEVWLTAELREFILVPLRTGELEIGPMNAVLTGRGYRPNGPSGGMEIKNPGLKLSVTEPPLAGRPAGYRLGDVGNFTMRAEVTPRTVETGELIAVTVRLAGSGNLPSQLAPPEQNGVEWLEPSVRGDVEPVGDSIGGERTLQWMVRLTAEGEVDLGELSLPFWDPDQNRYETARADLGKITVTPSKNTGAKAPPTSDTPTKGADAFAPRRTRSEVTPPSQPLDDSPWYWLLVLGAPLSVPAVALGDRLVRRVSRRSSKRSETGAARAAVSFDEGVTFEHRGDVGKAAAAYEKALVLGLEGATGVKVRGVLKPQLVDALVSAGLDESRARESTELLDRLETVRFSGEGSLDGAGSRCKRLLSELARLEKKHLRRASREALSPSGSEVRS